MAFPPRRNAYAKAQFSFIRIVRPYDLRLPLLSCGTLETQSLSATTFLLLHPRPHLDQNNPRGALWLDMLRRRCLLRQVSTTLSALFLPL